MKSPNQNVHVQNPGAAAAEESLRLVASLPAPQGLEDRVNTALQVAPRTGRVLHWPSRRGGSAWMRGTAVRAAAAAAIVFAVAGGGWGVYSRVQISQAPKVIAMPQRINAPGGFSNAGAMRTPQTLNGPVLAHPVTTVSKQNDGDEKIVPVPKKTRHAKAGSTQNSKVLSLAR